MRCNNTPRAMPSDLLVEVEEKVAKAPQGSLAPRAGVEDSDDRSRAPGHLLGQSEPEMMEIDQVGMPHL